MFQWIQGKSAEPCRRVIAHAVCDPAVGELVEDDRIEKRDCKEDEGGGIMDKEVE